MALIGEWSSAGKVPGVVKAGFSGLGFAFTGQGTLPSQALEFFLLRPGDFAFSGSAQAVCLRRP
jgi:hypothetical protein